MDGMQRRQLSQPTNNVDGRTSLTRNIKLKGRFTFSQRWKVTYVNKRISRLLKSLSIESKEIKRNLEFWNLFKRFELTYHLFQ